MYEFVWWWFFAVLPLPLLVRRLWQPASDESGVALRIPFLNEFRSSGQQKKQHYLHRWVLLLAILSWVALVTATARPVWVGDAVNLPVSGRDLMLAVDLSGSMQEQDFRVNNRVVDRLYATKVVAGEFISQRQGDRIGLVLFGDQAYLQAPLTFDRQTVRILLNEAAIGLAGERTAIGEETGKVNPEAEYNWLIDPIDGTKSFVRRYPFFSTQIALMKGNELILGVSNAPEFGEMAYAEKGFGAYLNGQAIKVSGYSDLNQSALSLGNIATLAGKPQWQTLGGIIQEVQRIRGYGDFYHYHLLASGKIDLIIESDVNILDIAALSVIVSEAGGTFTDLSGNPITLDTTTVLATGNQSMHQQICQRLTY